MYEGGGRVGRSTHKEVIQHGIDGRDDEDDPCRDIEEALRLEVAAADVVEDVGCEGRWSAKVNIAACEDNRANERTIAKERDDARK